jgi:hypothetical protein
MLVRASAAKARRKTGEGTRSSRVSTAPFSPPTAESAENKATNYDEDNTRHERVQSDT